MFQIKPDRKETENKTVRFPVDLIDKIEKKVTSIVRESLSHNNYSYLDLKNQIILDLSPYISALTGRHPMILPVIMEVRQSE